MLLTINYLVSYIYISYTIFFKINNNKSKLKVVKLLKKGLKKTLS